MVQGVHAAIGWLRSKGMAEVSCAGIIVERIAPDHATLIQLADAGIGTRMLARDLGLENRLMVWRADTGHHQQIRPENTFYRYKIAFWSASRTRLWEESGKSAELTDR